METKILLRVKKGYLLTKKQEAWLKENVDPRFDRKCEHCMFNLHMQLGLL
jgi:hypothetical protein